MPAESQTTRIILRTVLIVILAALALYVIYRVRKPLGFVVVAAFIAVAMTGPVNLLERKMKRGLAVAVALASATRDKAPPAGVVAETCAYWAKVRIVPDPAITAKPPSGVTATPEEGPESGAVAEMEPSE